MDTWTVYVGVSWDRPYRLDEWRKYTVMADGPVEARLIAEQMAFCTAAPVKAEVVSVLI